MKAWHFSNTNCRLGYGDNRRIEAGITHTVDGEPVLCKHGLHASKSVLDALRYAPGRMVWRVELGGEIIHGNNKLVATERTYLWGYDATHVLRRFACMCALDVLPNDVPEVVTRYLKTQDEPIRPAARDAARSAAWSAARSAAWSAARDAARPAARDAAFYAARDAAFYAAWSAARDAAEDAAEDAAWDAARKKQERWLYRMIMAGRKGGE